MIAIPLIGFYGPLGGLTLTVTNLSPLQAAANLASPRPSRATLEAEICTAIDEHVVQVLACNPSAAAVDKRRKCVHSVSLRNDIVRELIALCRPGARAACQVSLTAMVDVFRPCESSVPSP